MPIRLQDRRRRRLPLDTNTNVPANLGDKLHSPPTAFTSPKTKCREKKSKKPRRDIVTEFAGYFGEDKLENWQRLCRDVGIQDDLRRATQCRTALKKVWVNIYDLLDAVKCNTKPHHFRNLNELREYTFEHEKIFPKKEAKEGGPVKCLLAHLFAQGRGGY